MDSKYNIIIVVPVLNEENYLLNFIKSIVKQTIKPTEIVVVNNGSIDKTAELAKKNLCVVLYCKKKGIGPARSVGVDYVLNKYKNYLDKTIIIQLDCDELIIRSDYIAKVVEAYKSDKNLIVTTGPVHYEINLKKHQKRVVETGKQFRKIFYVKTLAELFADFGRDINNYLIPASNHKFFTGGNTTYRADVFKLKNVSFPQNKSWESIVISIRIQQHISEDQIRFVKEQAVITSSRSFTNSEGIVSPSRLKCIRKRGYIQPYKSKNSLSPQQTVNKLIRQIDKETYNLSNNEYVKYVKKVIIKRKNVKSYNNYKVLPMLHASTLKLIPNKYILIKY
ncbi:glycosyltransferase family 2 protein [Patescibacteria group bacterium]|nr:glycosyltransferase family 2 protein [Patescibacteria group bacterium]MBU4264911.1 glycosyltransferase family 2 protein [Patescibacteria group bacterium]MBU4389660.1 glycosyltransferase family 2 protein [Patescibacteria group bacterium]MBU4397120.1 glycosyltransferase family 2 protein [Patescibacteria group bacterium]MBU4430960.1 glycosyltransferase family 2 protein [Patescibacteria group bacterium]